MRRRRPGDRPAAAAVQCRDGALGLVRPQAASLNHTLDALDRDAREILRAAVAAIDPGPLVAAALSTDFTHPTRFTGTARLRARQVHVVAAGKAAWPMARAAHASPGLRIASSLVSGPRGRGALPGDGEWIDAAHPLPDAHSVRAGRRALEIAARARDAGEPLLVLLSGGGSSMLSAPAGGVPLDDKRRVADALMRAGADITSLNCVRKHLSSIKGGRLAAAAGATVTLAISDVHEPADDPGTIASGPTVPDDSSPADAIRVLNRFGIEAPRSVRAHLEASASAGIVPPAREADGASTSTFRVIANRWTAMRGAAAGAERLGYATCFVDAPTRGEAREAGRAFAAHALAMATIGERVCIIASGETTVTVRRPGKGGRNQEFVLGAAPVLARSNGPAILASFGTDGIDGPTDAAGAIATSTTLARCEAAGLDVADALARNDAYPTLSRLGDLLVWGPTHTNVGDLHLLLTMQQ